MVLELYPIFRKMNGWLASTVSFHVGVNKIFWSSNDSSGCLHRCHGETIPGQMRDSGPMIDCPVTFSLLYKILNICVGQSSKIKSDAIKSEKRNSGG